MRKGETMSLRQQKPLPRFGVIAGALLACIALLGVAASSAAAKEQRGFFVTGAESGEASKKPRFEAEKYSSFVLGTGDEEYGFAIGSMTCPESEFSTTLASAASQLSLNGFRRYFSCKAPFGFNMTIMGNGCQDILTVSNAGPPYVGTYGLSCGAQEYEYNLGNGSCRIRIPTQTVPASVEYSNSGEGTKRVVTADIEVSSLKYSISTERKIFNPCYAHVGTYENGTYSNTMTIAAYDSQF
jgi:hypothetical protein